MHPLLDQLEKTEQSITLALQEIDRNFAAAHKIVSSVIAPVIDKYDVHSRAILNGSAFWSQFMEASASISLSGYEEEAVAVVEGDGDNGGGDDSAEGKGEVEVEVEAKPGQTGQPGQIVQIQETENTQPETDTVHPDNTLPERDDNEKEIFSSPFNSRIESIPSTPIHSLFRNGESRSVIKHQVLDKNWGITATPVPEKHFKSPFRKRPFAAIDNSDDEIVPPALSHLTAIPALPDDSDPSIPLPHISSTPAKPTFSLWQDPLRQPSTPMTSNLGSTALSPPKLTQTPASDAAHRIVRSAFDSVKRRKISEASRIPRVSGSRVSGSRASGSRASRGYRVSGYGPSVSRVSADDSASFVEGDLADILGNVSKSDSDASSGFSLDE